MPHRPIATRQELDDLSTLLAGLKLPITVSWVQGRDRSADQNALMWKWATEAGDQIGETADEVQRRWKLNHGVPILCEDSDEFRRFCRLALGRLFYEERLEAMRYVPVTSDMKVRQMVRFMDTVWRECGEQKIVLTNPDPDLAAYQARYREPQEKAA